MTGNFIEDISNEVLKKAKKIVFDKDTKLKIYNETDLIIKPVIRFEGNVDEDGVLHGRSFAIYIYKEEEVS